MSHLSTGPWPDISKMNSEQQEKNTADEGLDSKSNRISWDIAHMLSAVLAAHRSKNKRSRVGCVLVSQSTNQMIGYGFNGLPHIPENDQALNGTLPTNKPINFGICAETNAILHSQKTFFRQENPLVCYVSLFPCYRCAEKLCQIGVKKVVYLHGNDSHSNTLFVRCKVELEKLTLTEKDIPSKLKEYLSKWTSLGELEDEILLLGKKAVSTWDLKPRLSWNQFFFGLSVVAEARCRFPFFEVEKNGKEKSIVLGSGCVIIGKDKRIVSFSYSGRINPYSGKIDPNTNERTKGIEGTYLCGELNGFLFANIESLENSRLYTTNIPCKYCVELILQSKVSRVYYLNKDHQKQNESDSIFHRPIYLEKLLSCNVSFVYFTPDFAIQETPYQSPNPSSKEINQIPPITPEKKVQEKIITQANLA